MLECRVIGQDVHGRKDAFLWSSKTIYDNLSSMYSIATEGADGFAVEMVEITGAGDTLMVWLKCCPYLKGINCSSASSYIKPGRYLLSVPSIPLVQLSRVVLMTESEADYALIQTHAELIMDSLFLKQVRVVHCGMTLPLFIEERRKAYLRVTGVDPKGLERGLVGLDTELEILATARTPPANGEMAAKQEGCNGSFRLKLMSVPGDASFCLINPASFNEAMPKSLKVGKTMRIPVLPSELAEPGWIYASPAAFKAAKFHNNQWIPASSLSAAEEERALAAPLTLSTDIGSVEFEQHRQVEGMLGRLLRSKPKVGAIMQGESLVGKSTMCKYLVERSMIPMAIIDMDQLLPSTGKAISLLDTQDRIRDAMKEILPSVAPCILIIDHADALLAGGEDEDDAESSFLRNSLVLDCIELFRQVSVAWETPTMLVVESAEKLSHAIRDSLLWPIRYTMRSPEADLRRSIILPQEGAEDELLVEFMVQKTAGKLPLAVRNGMERISNHHASLDAPIAVKGSLVPRWDEIPGVCKARAELEEALLWPILYSDRLETAVKQDAEGVLVWGPSGVGKSMLVRSFLEQLQDRLPQILVKKVAGPSLLGKYVGSSEAAVRELFAQGRRAPPCLIVIEELEAMAPRRGTDRTGTTDRVVNQLLTELDGVEGRSGIHVLALTSRPDLVDPAVLRPGRLGTHIFMGLPSKSDRLEIIKHYAPESIAEDQLLLEQVAMGTEGWTGADLKGLWERILRDQNYSGDPPIDPDALLTCLVELQEEKKMKESPRPSIRPRVTLA